MFEPQSTTPLLDDAVEQLAKLPGIGRKTALRLALHILRQEPDYAQRLAASIADLRDKTTYCQRCHNISQSPLCPICADATRDQSLVCVVENVKDVLAVEATSQYRGLYHVLGGLVSPIEGVSPDDLEIQSLIERVDEERPEEVILALSPTIEGDTTAYYIGKRLSATDVRVTALARGIPLGNDLEYTDTLTLARSLAGRTPLQ